MGTDKQGIYWGGLDEYKGALRRQWLVRKEFAWIKGPFAEHKYDNRLLIWDNLVKDEAVEDYFLKSEDTWNAFRELGDCISSPGLVMNRNDKGLYERRDIFKGAFPSWMGRITIPDTPSNQKDRENLKSWVEKYGLPSPYIENQRGRGTMDVIDILIIAHLARTAYELFDRTQTRRGRTSIKNMAHIVPHNLFGYSSIYFCVSPKEYESTSEPGLSFTQELSVSIDILIEDITPEKWRHIALLWISGICRYFIDIEVQVMFTKKFAIRPVLSPSSLLSWLWFSLLSVLSEADEILQGESVCADCGRVYIGKSQHCPDCRRSHLNKIKKQSKENKEIIMALLDEGKNIDEIERSAIVIERKIKRESIERWAKGKMEHLKGDE